MNSSAARDVFSRLGHDDGHVEDLRRDELHGGVLGGAPDEQNPLRSRADDLELDRAILESRDSAVHAELARQRQILSVALSNAINVSDYRESARTQCTSEHVQC